MEDGNELVPAALKALRRPPPLSLSPYLHWLRRSSDSILGAKRSMEKLATPSDINQDVMEIPSVDEQQVNIFTEVKATLIPLNDTFHTVTTTSSYKMEIDVCYGTGAATKLSMQTRNTFLFFRSFCGYKGYSFVESQISTGRSKIILEKNNSGRRRLSLRFGMSQSVAAIIQANARDRAQEGIEMIGNSATETESLPEADVSPLRADVYYDDAEDILPFCVSSESDVTITPFIYTQNISKPSITVTNGSDPVEVDSDDDGPDWSVSPTTTSDNPFNRSRSATLDSTASYSTTRSSVCSHSHVAKASSASDINMPLPSPTLSLTFEHGKSIRLSTEYNSLPLNTLPSTSTESLPYIPTQDVTDGLIINGEFHSVPQGCRRSRRKGIYFGTDIVTLTEVKTSLPVIDPVLMTIEEDTLIPKDIESKKVNERPLWKHGRSKSDSRFSQKLLKNHKRTMSELTWKGPPSIDNRIHDVRYRWHERMSGRESPVSETPVATLTEVEINEQSQRHSRQLRASIAYHRCITHESLLDQSSSTPPTLHLPSIHDAIRIAAEKALKDEEPEEVEALTEEKLRKFLDRCPKRQPPTSRRGKKVKKHTQSREIIAAKKAAARRMKGKGGFVKSLKRFMGIK